MERNSAPRWQFAEGPRAPFGITKHGEGGALVLFDDSEGGAGVRFQTVKVARVFFIGRLFSYRKENKENGRGVLSF